ncbi:hypothetical protein FI353_05800 [Campylobacter coli]|nr:hypothetical protein [Campylobacter coli]
MKDFVFIQNENLIPLPDEINIWENCKDEEVLISNEKAQKAQIYAPEINFYLKSCRRKNKMSQKKNKMSYFCDKLSFFQP